MVTTKKKHLSEFNKARAIAWWEEGVSQHEVSRRLKVHRRTISRLVTAYQKSNNGSLPQRRSGSGRPKKVTDKMLAKIKKDILSNPFLTARQIKSKNRKLLETISLRTVRRILLENLSLASRVAARKPILSNRMKHNRIEFAKQYQHWTSKQWGSVLYSDESLFKTSQTTGRLVRRELLPS
jgi:transposase